MKNSKEFPPFPTLDIPIKTTRINARRRKLPFVFFKQKVLIFFRHPIRFRRALKLFKYLRSWPARVGKGDFIFVDAIAGTAEIVKVVNGKIVGD